ncbi:MAG: mercuric reductase [Candidatus Manganitrophus sp. SA1]|nr:mercuric reductase [Candidatus Manganitrophus morganii]
MMLGSENDHELGMMLPSDEYNRTLINNVHPSDWVNPEPTGRYNLVVIGAGTAGLVTAAVAAALGAKVALIERHLMGGDCLNVGCVPSKGMLRAARAWADLRNGAAFGAETPDGVRYNFGAAMARMRRLRARISPNDSARRFQQIGVDVFLGDGRFVGPDAVEVGGRRLLFSKAAICTGARAAAPPIPGLKETGYLTNETVFSLTERPSRIAVIGGGPIGCELAQAFARFGSRVTLFEKNGQILRREDVDAAGIVQARMEKDGVEFAFHANLLRAERRGSEKVLYYRDRSNGEEKVWIGDAIQIGVGRAPNVEGLGLEKAGVDYDTKTGVRVNARLQTTNPKIYAAGDVCFSYQFTHTADALAQIVIQNALFPHPLGLGYASTDALIIPWCTYTEPELAHVGLTEADAKAKGIEVASYTYPLDEVDRAILDGEEEGFARVHIKKGTDTIVGATVVAAHSGDLISLFTLAMKGELGLGTITGTIFPYPTQAEAVKKAATLWRKTTLTEGKKKILRRWFAWAR